MELKQKTNKVSCVALVLATPKLFVFIVIGNTKKYLDCFLPQEKISNQNAQSYFQTSTYSQSDTKCAHQNLNTLTFL